MSFPCYEAALTNIQGHIEMKSLQYKTKRQTRKTAPRRTYAKAGHIKYEDGNS